MKGFLAFPILLLLLFSTPVNAHFATGLEAYNSGDYATAIKEWKPLAEKGMVDAQFNLAWMHYFGKGVKRSYTTAAKWFQLAAEQEGTKMKALPVITILFCMVLAIVGCAGSGTGNVSGPTPLSSEWKDTAYEALSDCQREAPGISHILDVKYAWFLIMGSRDEVKTMKSCMKSRYDWVEILPPKAIPNVMAPPR